MSYIINESGALKKKLSGIRVGDTNAASGGRVVPVEFVDPDFEIGDAVYPGIYITYGTIHRASDREMRGPILLPYAPEGYPGNVLVPADMLDTTNTARVPWLLNADSDGDPTASPYKVDESPIPYDLNFQVAVFARNYQHTTQITSRLAEIDMLPERFGYLEVPEDGTVRTLELAGGPEISIEDDTDGKRMLQTLYSVTVASELNLAQVREIGRVTGINITMENTTYPAFEGASAYFTSL